MQANISFEKRFKFYLNLTLDYGDGTLLFHLFFNVMRNRNSGYFSKVLKISRSEIENKITSHKLILVESCYFYHF